MQKCFQNFPFKCYILITQQFKLDFFAKFNNFGQYILWLLFQIMKNNESQSAIKIGVLLLLCIVQYKNSLPTKHMIQPHTN